MTASDRPDPAGAGSGWHPGDITRRVAIANKRGLHARAAAKFVKLAVQFDAAVSVTCRDQTVSGRSIMGLMMLAAAPGSIIDIRAGGPQAAAALDALVTLVEGKFDED